MSAVVFELLANTGSAGAGMLGLLAAVAGASMLITGIVVWIAAVVIALRSGSLLWLFVAVLPILPVNALMCAMFCPAARGERR